MVRQKTDAETECGGAECGRRVNSRGAVTVMSTAPHPDTAPGPASPHHKMQLKCNEHVSLTETMCCVDREIVTVDSG